MPSYGAYILQFFVEFLWKTEIYEYAEQLVRDELLSFIRTIYVQRPVYYNHLFSISDILDVIIERIDTKSYHDSAASQSALMKASPLISN